MRASDYLTEDERVNVAGAAGTGAGAAMLAACKGEQKRMEKKLLVDAKINCEKIEDDIRFHLGAIWALGFLGRLRECARKELGMREDDEE